MTRTLTLTREALTELSVGELRTVAGGDSVLSVGSCPLRDCIPPTRISCRGCYTEPC